MLSDSSSQSHQPFAHRNWATYPVGRSDQCDDLTGELPNNVCAKLVRLVGNVLEVPVVWLLLVEPTATVKTAYGLDPAGFSSECLPLPVPLETLPEDRIWHVTIDPESSGAPDANWTIGDRSYAFFASAPLRTSEGLFLGFLGLLDSQARQLTPAQSARFQEFAELVSEELDLHLAAVNHALTERALRDSDAELQAVFRALNDVILILDADGRYLKIAPTNPRLLHLPIQDKVGKTLHEVLPQAQADTFLSLIRYTLETQQTVSAEYTLTIEDTEVNFSTNISPLSENTVVWVARDVTEYQQAEDALQQSITQIRLIMDSVPARIAYIDQDEYYRFVNRRYEEWFQLPAEEIVGKRVRDLVGDPIYRSLRPQITRVLRGAEVSYEDSMISMTGEEHYMHVTYVPHREDNQVMGYYVLVYDITDRKRAEQALQKSEQDFRQLIQDLQAGVLLQGPDAEILLCNKAALDLLGVSEDQLLGRTSFDPEWNVIYENGDPFPGEVHPVPQAIARKQPIENVVMGVYRPRQGDRIWLLVNAKPELTVDGKVRRVLCTFSDITAHKQAEEALRRSHEELERRVLERTEALAQANQQLRDEILEHERTEAALHLAEEGLRQSLAKERELSDLKSRFITTASHEFRTPLTIMLTSVELLKRYGPIWAEEKRSKYFERMQDAVYKMTAILNDILILAKMEAGKLDCDPVAIDLQVFCQELVEELEMDYGLQNRLCLLINGELEEVKLDTSLLWQILSNLLTNAIKYSAADSKVQLEVIQEPDSVMFRVHDTGIGIPSEDLPHIFESFHRASNVATISGTGLGLAIVQRCVDLHGGTITIESEMGTGTTVVVTLPRSHEGLHEEGIGD